jgi:hypothetical protein
MDRHETFCTASARRWAAVSAADRTGRRRSRCLPGGGWIALDGAAFSRRWGHCRSGGRRRRSASTERPPARDLRPEGRGMAAERGRPSPRAPRSCCACQTARRCRPASSRACGGATRSACRCRSGGNSSARPLHPCARPVLASRHVRPPKDPVRPTDDEARALARSLIAGARSGALGVIDPETAPRWSRASPWCPDPTACRSR